MLQEGNLIVKKLLDPKNLDISLGLGCFIMEFMKLTNLKMA